MLSRVAGLEIHTSAAGIGTQVSILILRCDVFILLLFMQLGEIAVISGRLTRVFTSSMEVEVNVHSRMIDVDQLPSPTEGLLISTHQNLCATGHIVYVGMV